MLCQTMVQIILTDLSTRLDNVLAVAGVAEGRLWILVARLAVSVLLMGLAAGVIARLLDRVERPADRAVRGSTHIREGAVAVAM